VRFDRERSHRNASAENVLECRTALASAPADFGRLEKRYALANDSKYLRTKVIFIRVDELRVECYVSTIIDGLTRSVI